MGLILFAMLAASVVTYAATRGLLVIARRRLAEAEAEAEAARRVLEETLEQLAPQHVPEWRLPDLTGWGSRGLVYGGPGGTTALLAALVGAAMARSLREISRGPK